MPAGERCHEPLPADEMLGSDSARQVDGVAAGPGSDNGEVQRSRDRQADVDGVLGPTIAYQGSGNAVINSSSRS
jgi:hypothetical protein